MPPRLRDWQRKVLKAFNGQTQRVFRYSDLTGFLTRQGSELGVPEYVSTARLTELLTKRGDLRQISVLPEITQGEKNQQEQSEKRTVTRYAWGTPSPYTVALSIRPNSYLTHASALFLQNLTEQIPKTIYVNKEQSIKRTQQAALTQEAIDRAFAREPRVSKYRYTWEGFRILLISGKNTSRLEVTQLELPTGELADVTKIERTLIDAVVRPFYAGGVVQVLHAFRAARSKMSVNTLVATLEKLAYTYPYHQAIGFYMERAGYEEKELAKLRALGLQYNFYLSYGLKELKYDAAWRLHYPQGI